VLAVFQSVAALEIYPPNVKVDADIAVPPGVVTAIVPVVPVDAVTVICVELSMV
jgi:hypothetical protein